MLLKIRVVLVLLGLLLVSGQAGSAQTKPLPTANRDRIDLGPHLLAFEDDTGSLSIDQLPPLDQADWKPVDDAIPSFGYSGSRIWFYLRLQRPNPDTVLVVGNPLLDSVDVFWLVGGQEVASHRAGDRFPFRQRPERHRLFLFPPPETEAETVDLYVSVASATSLQVPLTIWSRDAFHQHEDSLRVWGGLYAGLMLGMILYNGFLLLALRDRSYFFYVLYMGFPVLYFGAIHGLLYAQVWPESPGWNELILSVIVFGSVGFSALFTDSFLDLAQRNRPYHRVMYGIAAIAAMGMAVGMFVPFRVLAVPMAMLVAGSGFIYMGAGISMFRAGYRPARYYLLAWAVFISAVVVFALAKLGLVASNALNANAPLIGSAIEAVLLSFGLADRFNLIREQADQAQRDRLRAQTEGQYRRAASLRTLITGVAHQLNTPLGTGISAASLLLDDSERIRAQLREGHEPALDDIRRSTDRAVDASQLALDSFNRASRMVDRFKLVAVENHQEPATEFDLGHRLESVMDTVGPGLTSHGISSELQCPSGILCRGYPNALEEVVTEVISNATIHAFDDSTHAPHIAVTALADDKTARIIVKDNGVGIGSEDPQRLLDPFFSTKRGQLGKLGLGLYIAYGVVTDRLGGRMDLRSDEDGLEITLSLPRHAPSRSS